MQAHTLIQYFSVVLVSYINLICSFCLCYSTTILLRMHHYPYILRYVFEDKNTQDERGKGSVKHSNKENLMKSPMRSNEDLGYFLVDLVRHLGRKRSNKMFGSGVVGGRTLLRTRLRRACKSESLNGVPGVVYEAGVKTRAPLRKNTFV